MTLNLGLFDNSSVSSSIQVNNEKTHCFTIIPSGVVNNVVRIEFSEDSITWYNIIGYDYEITDAEVHNLIVTEVRPISNLRFRYVSGTGEVRVYYKNY